MHSTLTRPVTRKDISQLIAVVAVLFFVFMLVIDRSAPSSEASTETSSQNQQKESAEHAAAERKREAEERMMKVEQEAPGEEEKQALAKKYCSERSSSVRYYSLYGTSSDSEANEPKRGKNLTLADCRGIIDELVAYHTSEAFLSGNFKTSAVEHVVSRRYWIGMSYNELTMSLGIPSDMNTSNYAGTLQHQWVYDYGSAGTTYFYLGGVPLQVNSYQDF